MTYIYSLTLIYNAVRICRTLTTVGNVCKFTTGEIVDRTESTLVYYILR